MSRRATFGQELPVTLAAKRPLKRPLCGLGAQPLLACAMTIGCPVALREVVKPLGHREHPLAHRQIPPSLEPEGAARMQATPSALV